MFNTIFGQLGQGFNQGHMAQQNAAQATQYGMAHNAAQQSAMAQQAAQQQAMNMSQGQMAGSPAGFGAGGFGQMYEPVKYMIDGESMTFEKFVNTIYPEDCAEKTMLILRLKKED